MGGAGGGCSGVASRGGNGEYYLRIPGKVHAKMDGRYNQGILDNSGIPTKADLDYAGGKVNGREGGTLQLNIGFRNYTFNGNDLPRRDGFLFLGYYLGNEQYFDVSGRLMRPWDLVTGQRLVARWVEAERLLCVNDPGDDEHTEQDPQKVTLRDALRHAGTKAIQDKIHGDLVITFNPGVDKVTLTKPITVGGNWPSANRQRLEINGLRISETDQLRPGQAVTITGPGGIECAGSVLDIAFCNLNFSGCGTGVRDGSVLTLNITGSGCVENCSFTACGAGTKKPLIAAKSLKGPLEIRCCTFKRNEGGGGGPTLIDVAGGECDVRILATDFDNNGKRDSGVGDLIRLNASSIVANCTFAENKSAAADSCLLRFGAASAVCNSIVHGNETPKCVVAAAPVRLAYVHGASWEPAGSVTATNCFADIGWSPPLAGPYATNVLGVAHSYYRAREDLVGAALWRDDTWKNVSVISPFRGEFAEFALRGDAGAAKNATEGLDQFGAPSPLFARAGSVAGDAAVDPACVDDERAGVFSSYDGDVTLKEAVSYVLHNRAFLGETVSFVGALANAVFDGVVELSGSGSVTIDGWAGRPWWSVADSNGPGDSARPRAVTFRGSAGAGLAFGSDLRPTLRNVQVVGFTNTAAEAVIELKGCASATFENCTLAGCGGKAVVGGRAAGAVEVARCTVADNAVSDAAVCVGGEGAAVRVHSCTFDRNAGRAVRGVGRELIVNASTFFANSAPDGIVANGADGMLTVCNTVFSENAYTSAEKRDITGLDGRSELSFSYGVWDRKSGARVRNCFDNSIGQRLVMPSNTTLVVDGVTHRVHHPHPKVVAGYLWHDEPWENISVSKLQASTNEGHRIEYALRGSAEKADELYCIDQTGNPWAVLDVEMVPTAGAIVDNTAADLRTVDIETDRVDMEAAPVSLREALMFADRYGDGCMIIFETNVNRVAFNPELGPMTVATNAFSSGLIVDGWAGRMNGRGTTLAGGGARGLAFDSGSTVKFKNLTFEGFGTAEEGVGAVATLKGTAETVFENCAFRGCAATGAGASLVRVLASTGDVEFVRCSFSSNVTASSASLVRTDGLADTAVISSSFVGNRIGDAGRTLDLAGRMAVVGCTFADNAGGSGCVRSEKPDAVVCDTIFARQSYASPTACDIEGLVAGSALAFTYGTWSGSCTSYCCRAERDLAPRPAETLSVDGVTHLWRRPAREQTAGLVLYDGGWDEIWISRRKDCKEPVRLRGGGAMSMFTDLYDDDLRGTGRTGGDPYLIDVVEAVPSAGAVVFDVADGLARVDLAADTEDCGDDRVSLREAVRHVATHGDTIDYVVSFSNALDGVVLDRPLEIAAGSFTNLTGLTVDGWFGRTNGTSREVTAARLFSTNGCRALLVRPANTVEFRNLTFTDFAGDSTAAVMRFDGCGDVTFENCRIANCRSRTFQLMSGYIPSGAFVLRRCTFADNEIQSSAFHPLIYVAARKMIVLSSTLAGNRTTESLIRWDGFGQWNGSRFLVGGCTFVGNAVGDEKLDELIQLSGQYGAACDCVFGWNDCQKTFSDGVKQHFVYVEEKGTREPKHISQTPTTNVVDGVAQLLFEPTEKTQAIGGFMWHDAGWEHAAVSDTNTGEGLANLWENGDPQNYLLYDDDITGEGGRYSLTAVPTAGSVVREQLHRLQTVNIEEDTEDLGKGISLRSAIGFAMKYCGLTKSEITFEPHVETVTLRGQIEVKGDSFPGGICIDGLKGREDRGGGVTISGGKTSSGLYIQSGNTVTLRNLMFRDFRTTAGYWQGAAVDHRGEGDLTIERCAFRYCVTKVGSAVSYFGATSENRSVRVSESSFVANETESTGERLDEASALRVNVDQDSPGDESATLRIAIMESTFNRNGLRSVKMPAVRLRGDSVLVAGCTIYNNGQGLSLTATTNGHAAVCSTVAIGNPNDGSTDYSLHFATPEKTVLHSVFGWTFPGSVLPASRTDCEIDDPKVEVKRYFTGLPRVVTNGVAQTCLRPASGAEGLGCYVVRRDVDWNANVACSKALRDETAPHIEFDIAGIPVLKEFCPAPGAVFYGSGSVFAPIVTTREPKSSSGLGTSLEEAIEYALGHADEPVVTFHPSLFDKKGGALIRFDKPIPVARANHDRTVVVRANAGQHPLIAFTPDRFYNPETRTVTELQRTRLFYVKETGRLRLEGLSISNAVGNAVGVDAAHLGRGTCGGAVLNYGLFEASNCLFTCCAAGPQAYGGVRPTPTGLGGAVCTVGPQSQAELRDCTFVNCHAASGGAVASADGGKLLLDSPAFRMNTAWDTLPGEGYGGAACRDGNESVLEFSGNPVFIGNVSYRGDEEWNDAVEVLTDSAGRIVVSRLATLSIEPIEILTPTDLCADSPEAAVRLAGLISVRGADWYTARSEGAEIRFALNEKAVPVIGDFELGAGSSGDGPVSVSVENGKPNLRYALGWSESPSGDFAEHLTERDWLSADAYGRVGPLTAPKGGDGRFYRLLVRPE